MRASQRRRGCFDQCSKGQPYMQADSACRIYTEIKVENMKFPLQCTLWLWVFPNDLCHHFNLSQWHATHRYNGWVLWTLQHCRKPKRDDRTGCKQVTVSQIHNISTDVRAIGNMSRALEVRLVKISLLTFSFHSGRLTVSLVPLSSSLSSIILTSSGRPIWRPRTNQYTI